MSLVFENEEARAAWDIKSNTFLSNTFSKIPEMYFDFEEQQQYKLTVSSLPWTGIEIVVQQTPSSIRRKCWGSRRSKCTRGPKTNGTVPVECIEVHVCPLLKPTISHRSVSPSKYSNKRIRFVGNHCIIRCRRYKGVIRTIKGPYPREFSVLWILLCHIGDELLIKLKGQFKTKAHHSRGYVSVQYVVEDGNPLPRLVISHIMIIKFLPNLLSFHPTHQQSFPFV